MRKLRRFHAPTDIAAIYGSQYDHARWPEHIDRVVYTIDVLRRLIKQYDLSSAADLSCGDRAVLDAISPELGYVYGNDITANGDGIEVTIKNLRPVDLFICTETIEHLEAPWTVLEEIAQRTRWLFLSCPLDESPAVGNYEHYWSFTKGDIYDLLAQAGFVVESYDHLCAPGWTYDYQLWVARVPEVTT